MLMYGLNIQSPADNLQPMIVGNIFEMIKKPDNDFISKIKQLRIIKQLDSKQYTAMKKSLPYFVCGSFNLPFRRTENFAYTDCFVIDIDHVIDKGLDIASLRHRIQNDERVMLCYVSPGGDGLKVMFKLSDKCYDAGMYSLFYKTFLRRFSDEYELQQVADTRTSDVTRACFMSYDEDVYYNEDAVAVRMNAYLECDNVQQLFDEKRSIEIYENEIMKSEEKPVVNPDPDEIALNYIRQILADKSPANNKKTVSVFVPQILADAMSGIKLCIEKTGIIVDEVIDIQYGKKLRVKLGMLLGEINIFYGKRGFSVVQSPRKGTSGDLNKITADIVDAHLAL